MTCIFDNVFGLGHVLASRQVEAIHREYLVVIQIQQN